MSNLTDTKTDNMGGITMTDTITRPETTGADMQDAEPKRPFWQTEPCPAWCAYPEFHQDHEAPEDRVHFGSTRDITLTLKDPVVLILPGNELHAEIPYLNVYMMQGWREHEPCINLSLNHEPEIPLSVAEAAELAETLSALVAAAREAGPGAGGDGT